MTSNSEKYWLNFTHASSHKRKSNTYLLSIPMQWKTSQSFSAFLKLPKTKSSSDAATGVFQIHHRTCLMWRRVHFYLRQVSWMWSESKLLIRKEKMMNHRLTKEVIITGRPLVSRLRKEVVTWYKIGLALLVLLNRFNSSKYISNSRCHLVSTLRQQVTATISLSTKTPFSLTLMAHHSVKYWKMQMFKERINSRVQYLLSLLTCLTKSNHPNRSRLRRTHNIQPAPGRRGYLPM